MQAKRQGNGVVAGILLPVGLICLFAFCSLALALMGGQAYKKIQASVDDSHGTTVASAYLRTKLTRHNSEGAVQLRDEGGIQVLVLEQISDGVAYETRIFMYEGRLVERYDRANAAFQPQGGMTIARLAGCAFSLDADGLFTAELVSEAGTTARTSFAVAKGGAV